MKYTLQAGRSILKDDQPFVHIARSTLHSKGGHAFTPVEADAFAREAVTACNAAPAMAQSLKDAIAMLRWQAERPVSAASWGEWMLSAMAALEDYKS